MSDDKVAATFHPSKAAPTPAEYKQELEDELAELQDARPSQYVSRRIKELTRRLERM